MPTLGAGHTAGDVVFYLPSRWEDHFIVGEFDLHGHVKAAAAQLGMPIQIVTDHALSHHCRASVF